MKTQLGKDYRGALSEDALTQIQTWAASGAEACHAYGDQTEDANVAAAFHADGSKFRRLDQAIRELLA